ncbi:hypothetical protein [Bradyrhizobium sp. B117]|uniref:hypothetical protein n=1 Tax=Bradyrhizobium sp. B117 TaxID=3140246 RepID=UPI0031843645
MQQANTNIIIRNPFGTMDVPAPDDREVMDYAATTSLAGGAGDVNATTWASIAAPSDPLEGTWASRWNGGADPTIAGDTPERWKEGRAEVRVIGERLYLRFDWDHGRRCARGYAAGREVHQPDQPRDHAAMGRARGR